MVAATAPSVDAALRNARFALRPRGAPRGRVMPKRIVRRKREGRPSKSWGACAERSPYCAEIREILKAAVLTLAPTGFEPVKSGPGRARVLLRSPVL